MGSSGRSTLPQLKVGLKIGASHDSTGLARLCYHHGSFKACARTLYFRQSPVALPKSSFKLAHLLLDASADRLYCSDRSVFTGAS